MPWLSNANQQFELVLSEPSNTASQWVASYADTDSNGRTSAPATVNGVSNTDTTAKVLFTGPASGLIRNLLSFSCFNADDLTHGMTIQLNDNGTVYQEVLPISVLSTESLFYADPPGPGWYLSGGGSAVPIVGVLPISVTYSSQWVISLVIGGDAAAAGEYLSYTASGTLTALNPLDDAAVTNRLSGIGAPSASIGNTGSTYFDVTDQGNIQFYWKT